MIFKKENNNLISIAIEKEVYTKIKIISDLENKNFSEIIEEALQGKQLTL